jgi:hypothetical protein
MMKSMISLLICLCWVSLANAHLKPREVTHNGKTVPIKLKAGATTILTLPEDVLQFEAPVKRIQVEVDAVANHPRQLRFKAIDPPDAAELTVPTTRGVYRLRLIRAKDNDSHVTIRTVKKAPEAGALQARDDVQAEAGYRAAANAPVRQGMIALWFTMQSPGLKTFGGVERSPAQIVLKEDADQKMVLIWRYRGTHGAYGYTIAITNKKPTPVIVPHDRITDPRGNLYATMFTPVGHAYESAQGDLIGPGGKGLLHLTYLKKGK